MGQNKIEQVCDGLLDYFAYLYAVLITHGRQFVGKMPGYGANKMELIVVVVGVGPDIGFDKLIKAFF